MFSSAFRQARRADSSRVPLGLASGSSRLYDLLIIPGLSVIVILKPDPRKIVKHALNYITRVIFATETVTSKSTINSNAYNTILNIKIERVT